MRAIDRDLHRVSTKALLYTPNYSHILVMHMFPGTHEEMFALPGGHVDAGEVPDQTIHRELDEELGIKVDDLQHVDFFMHVNGKIILAYQSTLPYDTVFHPSKPHKEIGIWLTKPEFEALSIEPNYKRAALEHWRE